MGKGMIAKFLIERGRTWNPAKAQLHCGTRGHLIPQLLAAKTFRRVKGDTRVTKFSLFLNICRKPELNFEKLAPEIYLASLGCPGARALWSSLPEAQAATPSCARTLDSDGRDRSAPPSPKQRRGGVT